MLGTKEDFELIRQQINIEAVANHLMKKQGKNYIFPSEKSASVRIYPETQSFYDFGRCTGGDVIRLWSHVRDVDSWTALCQIREISETFIKSVERQSFSMAVGMRLLRQNNRRM